MGRPRRHAWGIVVGILVAAATATVVVSWTRHQGSVLGRQAARARAVDNLRTIGLLLAENGIGLSRPYPPLLGKRFVLGLVAQDLLDRSDPRALSLLFSPGDGARSVEKAGGVAAYQGISTEALRDPTFDASSLTSYAGPGDSVPQCPVDSHVDAYGHPILADLSFSDVAIVLFSGGQVRTLTRNDLGLAAHEPMAAGAASSSPILRALSTE